MTFLLKPFLASFPAWRRRPWLLALFLLLAPAAFYGGRYLQVQSGRNSVFGMEGYDEIVMRARATAEALGIPAGQWRPSIRFTPGSEFNRFAQRERGRIPDAVRRILPVAFVRALLLEGQGKWVEFTYSGEGQLLGYEASPGLFASDAMLAQTGTREVAQSAAEAILSPQAFEFGEPSARSANGGMGQRFEWNPRAKCCPELALTAVVEVVGARPAFLSLSTSFTDDYLRRQNTPLNLLADVMRIGFLLVGTVFAGFRFAKRAMEREVPYARAAVIWGAMFAIGIALLILQPSGLMAGDALFIAGPFWFLGVAFGVLIYLVVGLLLALAYGATEGDLREMLPGKLTSLDTFLSGRIFSRNTGVSIVAGTAWGAWIYGITQAARAWLTPGFIPLHETGLRFSYSPVPWLGLIGSSLAQALLLAVGVVMLSLSIGKWVGGKSRGRRVWITAVCSLGAVMVGGSPFNDGAAVVMTISTLAMLWLGLGAFDFLATMAALIAAQSGTALSDLHAIMPAWRQPAAIAFLFGTVTLLAALVASYRGRRYEDAEVIPSYARNIEERHSRREEVSAAREAQLRLLPTGPPNILGLGLAAFCAPASEGVSGDFFDFYPMSRGRLGLLVADGRTGGLGAALTIAFSKGFVQYAAHRDWPAAETLRRLRELWRQQSDAGRGEFNLAYAVLDPAQRQIRFARLGATPVILAGLDAEDRAEPLTGPVADGMTEGSATFAPGDVLLFYTDGVPQRLAMSHRDEIGAWLCNKLRLSSGVTAYRIGEALQEALRTQEGSAAHDLTAVVIRFEPAQSAALEASA